MKCVKCNGECKGWKCAVCQAESTEHNPNHQHAESDRYCTMKCEECQQADVLCTCIPKS